MTLIKELIEHHGSEITSAITSKLGLTQDQAQGAIETVAPVVMNGLKSQQDSGGDSAVSGLLSQLGGSEDILGNLGNLGDLIGGQQNPLSALLGSESQGEAATQAVGQKLGLTGEKTGSLTNMIIPVVMGFLAKKGREDANTPDTSSGIAAILDRDGDGSAIDDIISMIGGSSNGSIGDIIGGFFGGKK